MTGNTVMMVSIDILLKVQQVLKCVKSTPHVIIVVPARW